MQRPMKEFIRSLGITWEGSAKDGWTGWFNCPVMGVRLSFGHQRKKGVRNKIAAHYGVVPVLS